MSTATHARCSRCGGLVSLDAACCLDARALCPECAAVLAPGRWARDLGWLLAHAPDTLRACTHCGAYHTGPERRRCHSCAALLGR